ncbi:hypothetical protein B0H14DRAFT_3158586 [Mycena olivaceomarginata]|nr:hypothetical protein B0H14DRAFT_3158586 [Mycena olivaceomarginata]
MALSNPGINLILGPVILGVIINTFMYGIVFTQSITYYTSSGYKKDSWFIKCLVSWALLLDTLHSCAVILLVWEYCITYFGDAAFLRRAPWPYSTTPIFSACTSVPIQIFLAWRVKRLSKSWLIFGVLSALSFTSGVMAVTSAIRALQAANIKVECLFMCRPMYSERMALLQIFAALIPFGDAWLALSVDTTVYIPAQKSHWILHQSKRLPSMVDLITFTVLPNTNFHVIFSLLSGRMYTNTLLARLNFRTTLCEDMGGVHSIPTAIRRPQVHVSVEQNQEVDITLEGNPRGRKSSGIPAVSNGSQTSVYQDGKGPVIA